MHINLLILLDAIERREDASRLRVRGLEYHQILELIEGAVAEGLIERTEEGLQLTDRGRSTLTSRKWRSLLRGPEYWILPKEDSRIDRLDPDEIYLPRPNWADD